MADEKTIKAEGKYLLMGGVFAALVILTVAVIYLGNQLSVMPKIDEDDAKLIKDFTADAVGQEYELTKAYTAPDGKTFPIGTKLTKVKTVDNEDKDVTNEVYYDPYIGLKPVDGSTVGFMFPLNSIKKSA